MKRDSPKQRKKRKVIEKRRSLRLKNFKDVYHFKIDSGNHSMNLHLVTKRKKNGTMNRNRRRLFRSLERKRNKRQRRISKTNDLMNYAKSL